MILNLDIIFVHCERTWWFRQNIILHTLPTETWLPLYQTETWRWNSLVLRRESAVPSQQQLPANISFNEGVTDDFGNAHGEPGLVILDDLLNDAYSKQVCDMCTRGSHHRNISVILFTQNLFHQGRFCRDISLNAHYIGALKTPEIRSSSRIWPIKYIPKIVSVCLTLT